METAIDYIESQPNDWQTALLALRQIILDFHPDITETFKWKCPFYLYKGYLAYMYINKKGLHLAFANGAKFDDTHGILQGKDRKLIRLITIDPSQDFPIKDIHYCLQLALDYNDNNRSTFSLKG